LSYGGSLFSGDQKPAISKT